MTRFFCPGRTELAGNHTDHQKGRVMAAAIDLGITAEAERNGERVIRVFSQGFDPIEIRLDRLWPEEREVGTPTALIKGMASILSEKGIPLEGFDAHVTSSLHPGAGLSSSAAFAVLTGYMIVHFSGKPDLEPELLARAAQKAENRWFGKPCGLMDPMACALGGAIYMDCLENRLLPVQCYFDELGLALCLTSTGSSHAGATDAYAAIPADMSAVAQEFGEPFLAMVRSPEFDLHWPEHTSDPAWMRARHFFDETIRVTFMADALGLRDGQRYMDLMNASGRSSETLLRNIENETCGRELAQGLDTAARLLNGKGAWRVHGGGFGGCVQALMPESEFPAYQAAMDERFGPGSCRRIHIRTRGVGLLEETSPSFGVDEKSSPVI